ncbi:olfactory receptor 52D1-like [Elephas maximus indicus]|uniref:olfactory receptor 52D1-like n=1 Tax=Elephas maximus indicus TaxID=99487 RepID=UPI0021160F87|nr:olfactory receptor 52D1-like [Elephas maximus indicus]
MAFDRYVAICNPLRHSSILTPRVIVSLSLAIVLRGAILLTRQPFSLLKLPYCKTVVSHTSCEFMSLIKLVCVNTRPQRIYGLLLAFLTLGLDFILIICSYIFILHAVFQLPSKKARLKTLNTCGTHVWAILVFFISAFFSFITQIDLGIALLHISTSL